MVMKVDSKKSRVKLLRLPSRKSIIPKSKGSVFLYTREHGDLIGRMLKSGIASRHIINFMFGDTQVFRLYFHTAPASVSTSVGGTNQQIYNFRLGSITAVSSLVLFDEYRIEGGSFHYMPNALNTYDSSVGTGHVPVTMGALVDYDDNSAVGSLAACWAHENAVITCTNQKIELPVKLMALPDKEWITTATTTTDVAYGKLFITGASISASYGVVYGTMTVDFRLVQA